MGIKFGSPMKTTINMAQKEGSFNRSNLKLMAICLGLAVVLFLEIVGIYGPTVSAARAEARAEKEEHRLEQLQEETTDYVQVFYQYQMETVTQTILNQEANPMECLALIEEELLSSAKVSSFTISSPVITVKLSNVTLNNVSVIYQRLMASEMVSMVQVYTAATQNDVNKMVTATMTITLDLERDEVAADGEEVAL